MSQIQNVIYTGNIHKIISKSKVVDKQTLCNTAKKAMKKWSANWNGFKQEHMSGFDNTENTPDGDSAQP